MLSNVKDSPTVRNPYRTKALANNLIIYLSRMLAMEPIILLVGEAPGYKGCARTGIPFTDEEHMMCAENGILGRRLGYERASIDAGYERENSATAIWETLGLDKYRSKIPLMWNIFPFHPFSGEDEETNRRPLSDEIKAGMEILEELLELFPSVTRIYAVGRVSETELIRRGFIPEKDAFYIRHPSYGGKAECISRLKEILKEP